MSAWCGGGKKTIITGGKCTFIAIDQISGIYLQTLNFICRSERKRHIQVEEVFGKDIGNNEGMFL